MAWCPHCSHINPTTITAASSSSSDPTTRFTTSCSSCGRVLNDGHHVGDDDIIATIATVLFDHLKDNNEKKIKVIHDAHHLFVSALEKEPLFSKGKGRRARSIHVAAACFYICLLRHGMPYMLMDLSDHLKVNVYSLAVVWLSLSTVLILPDLDNYSNKREEGTAIDPSLFMHRLSTRLLSGLNNRNSNRKQQDESESEVVASTALRIISNTCKKPRDWMLITNTCKNHITTLCTAALYIALLAHDHNYVSKSWVARLVHAEMETMLSAGPGMGLTIKEFVSLSRATTTTTTLTTPSTSNNDLDHMPSTKAEVEAEAGEELVCRHNNKTDCCYGLCRECYHVFTEICGSSNRNTTLLPVEHPQNAKRRTTTLSKTSEESFSDTNNHDINIYLNTKREKQYKTIIWELMNKDYLEDQAATSKAGKESKLQEEKRLERVKRARDSSSTAQATKDELTKNKRLSSRINYDVLSTQDYDCDYEDENKQGNQENKEKTIDTEAEEEIYGDEDIFDLEEDTGEGDYNRYYADDGNEEYLNDDFRF